VIQSYRKLLLIAASLILVILTSITFLLFTNSALQQVNAQTPINTFAECDMPGGANCWNRIDGNTINSLLNFSLPSPFNASASQYAITAKSIGGSSGAEDVRLWEGQTSAGEIWVRKYAYFPSSFAANTSCASRGLKFTDSRSGGGSGNAGGFLKLSEDTSGNLRLNFQTQFIGCQSTIANLQKGAWNYIEYHFKVNIGLNDLVEVWVNKNAATDLPSWSMTSDFWQDDDKWTTVTFNENWSGGTSPQTQQYYIKGAAASELGPIGDTFGLLSSSQPDTTPPTAPTSLQATAQSSSQIDLSWTASSDPESGIANYEVYRCTGSSCTPTTLIASPTGASYSDNTGLSVNTVYSYRVRTRNGAGLFSTIYSNTVSATTQATSTPSPTPASYACHILDSAQTTPQGYAVAYNPFTVQQELLLKATCNPSDTTVTIGNGNMGSSTNWDGRMWVWNQGYELVNGTWQATTYTCSGETYPVTGGVWCRGEATGTLAATSTAYLGYTCQWHSAFSSYKCGCVDTACTQPLWHLQQVQR
jgi:hypothetical protein